MTQSYNVGGREFATYNRASEDPGGYVTDTPCRILQLINESVSASLLKTTGVCESTDAQTEDERKAWRRHNLIREMAVKAGNGDLHTRQLMLAYIRRIHGS